MAWWGKVAGGTFGFMLGGPIGALLGAVLGHKLDAGVSRLGAGKYSLPGEQERVQAAFFAATFSVMGHVAKADGRVSAHEISMAQQLMAHMRLNSDQKEAAMTLFNRGKEADFDLTSVLNQFRGECHRRTTLIQMFIQIQVQAAFADGRIDPKESSILGRCAEVLGVHSSELERIIEMVRGGMSAQRSDGDLSVEDAYRVLGVDPGTPLPEVKKAYRRLLSRNHPDKLVSKGLPEEMVKLANEKTHEIQMAWKRVQASGA